MANPSVDKTPKPAPITPSVYINGPKVSVATLKPVANVTPMSIKAARQNKLGKK